MTRRTSLAASLAATVATLAFAGCGSDDTPPPTADRLAEYLETYSGDTGDEFCDLLPVVDGIEADNADATLAINLTIAQLNSTGSDDDFAVLTSNGWDLWEVGLIRSEFDSQLLPLIDDAAAAEAFAATKQLNDDFTVVFGRTLAEATNIVDLQEDLNAILTDPDLTEALATQDALWATFGAYSEERCGL